MSHDETEGSLLARVSSFAACPTLAELTREKLQQITASDGVDFAAALLFDRVKRSERAALFIDEIDQLRSLAPANQAGRGTDKPLIAIVPAAFYKEKPHSGADGRVVREAAARLNLECELIPIGSTGTLAETSSIILTWLKHHSGKRTTLVSLCKGGADVKFALSAPGAADRFANVEAWVNICGTLNGSPVAEWLLANKLRALATWLFLKAGGHDFTFLREIVPTSSSPLSAPLKLLPTMQLINVVGFPLRRHLSNGFMRRCHEILSPQGPNDGGVLLADACSLPGHIYPVWGADHYLRPDDRAQEIITAVLNWLMNQRDLAHSPPEPCPAS
jgi:hypothetical protein